MLTIEKLKEYGANVEEGVHRCADQEDFYLMMVKKSLESDKYDVLSKAIEVNDLDKAFEAAHNIKGVLGNLSLTPIYETAVELTEYLRARTVMDYRPLVKKLFNQKEELEKLSEN